MSKQISIYIDLGSLNSYLSLKPSLSLIKDFNLAVTWLPMKGIVKTVAHRKPKINADDLLAEVKLKRLKARASYEDQELRRNATTLGIPVSHAGKEVDAQLLHIGLLFLNENGIDPLPFISAAFEQVFTEGVDITDLETLWSLVEVSIDKHLTVVKKDLSDYLINGPSKFKELEKDTTAKGIFDSPAYQYAEQNFQGRAHLPLLRWYLGGEVGIPPV